MASKKAAKKARQRAKKEEAKVVAASLESVAAKESMIFETGDPSWSKIREATCDVVSVVFVGCLSHHRGRGREHGWAL